MSQIAIITDTHFGWKNDSIRFQNYFKKFYDTVFFPELRKRKISTVLHLGDLFERRTHLNVNILQRTRTDFLEKLSPYQTHIIVGNHDTYHKETNEVNSLREIVEGRYNNITIYEEPQDLYLDDICILLVPWLNPTNMADGLTSIAQSKADVLMGHLEIAGFKMDQMAQVSKHGLDRNIFAKFKQVFSGHFHHKSQDGVIQYLGAPYEYTFADLDDPKGFHIFDTETLELEFVQNPYTMFCRIVYDDRDPSTHEAMLNMDFSKYEGKIVRVIVSYKTDPVLYEKWMELLDKANPAEYLTKEQFSLEMSEEGDEQFGEFIGEDGQVIVSDTLTILNTYVDSIGMEVDKEKMKDVLKELYIEATTVS